MREYELRHQTDKKLSPGKFYPLGATPTGDGVNFAIYSHTATEVCLLLFDTVGGQPSDVIRMENRTKFIWHTLVHGLKAGQLYGYKMRGEYNPAYGMRFNEHKLLMDPYAKAIGGRDVWGVTPDWNNVYPHRARIVHDDFGPHGLDSLQDPVGQDRAGRSLRRGYGQRPGD